MIIWVSFSFSNGLLGCRRYWFWTLVLEAGLELIDSPRTVGYPWTKRRLFFFRVLDVCYVTYVTYVSKLCTWNDWRHKYAFQYLKVSFPRYSMIIPPIVFFRSGVWAPIPKRNDWIAHHCPGQYDMTTVEFQLTCCVFSFQDIGRIPSGSDEATTDFPNLGIVPSTTDTSVGCFSCRWSIFMRSFFLSICLPIFRDISCIL